MSDDRTQAQALYGRPDQMNGTPTGWRIELRRFHVAAGQYHAYLSLVDPSENVVGELHGFAQSKNLTKEERERDAMAKGIDGDNLVARHDKLAEEKAEAVATVAAGSREAMAKIWECGRKAVDAINEKQFRYKATDGPRDLGGEIQNSNSVAYTLGRVMGLPLDGAIEDAGMRRSFPGWGRDILDPNYRPYVPPSMYGREASLAP